VTDPAVTVRRGDCPCPGAPHSEEVVTLSEQLTLPIAAGAFIALRNAESNAAAQQAALTEAYLPAAIVSWTFVERTPLGDLGPVEITRESMERLVPWDKGGLEITDRADSLYSERLMTPLVALSQQPSPPGPTADSTSATPASGAPPRAPSRRSSRSDGDTRPFAAPGP
jgi:hypothetical protein